MVGPTELRVEQYFCYRRVRWGFGEGGVGVGLIVLPVFLFLVILKLLFHLIYLVMFCVEFQG